MTKKSHNKKRNVGIIYEQLVLKLSKALVENDYNLVFEAPFGSMGGDGMICATVEPVQQ